MNLNGIKTFCVAKCLRLFALLLTLHLALMVTPVFAYKQSSLNTQSFSEVAAATLPEEARSTLRLIKKGGPFPYPRDGVVFGNFEKRLPKKPRGFYHEYTVKTPGVRNRGARRIVCGQLPECYYSADHYQTFQLIRE
jgi:ribonuclease T1